MGKGLHKGNATWLHLNEVLEQDKLIYDGEKIQNKGERVDWERQAGSFWGNINVQQHDGGCTTQVHAYIKIQNSPNGPLGFVPIRTLVDDMHAEMFRVIYMDVCNLLHNHSSLKKGLNR